MMKLISWLIRWLELVFKYGVPLILGMAITASAVEHYRPWSAADSALGDSSRRTRIMIGFGIYSDGSETERSAEYLLLPTRHSKAQVATVRQLNELPPTVTIEEESLVSDLSWLCALLTLSAWLWLRPNAWRDMTKRWTERVRS